MTLVADLRGAIGPATAKLMSDAVASAEDRGAGALVVRINTPGGLASSMRDVISTILASPVPIVGFVAPPGAHAASAGTYIIYATHIAAMAPATNLGAATPVPLHGGYPAVPRRPDGSDQKDAKEAPKAQPEEPEKAKPVNDAVAFIRSLAQLRGRNAEWAEKAVREAASLSATDALKLGVIDVVAADVRDLLDKIDGRAVTIAGKERVLATRASATEVFEPTLVTRMLAVLTNPNVALILVLIGAYGLIFEFANPGTIGPGVAGAIFLLLGLYALNQLPLNYAALGLLVLGILFMVAEAFTPTLGALGIGGLIAFILGAAMLVDTDVPQFQLSWSVIATTAAVSAATLTLLLGYVLRAQRRPVVTGQAQLIGSKAEVLDWSGRTGHVWAHGERWDARGDADLKPHAVVRVSGMDGLTLLVHGERGASLAASRQGRGD